MHKQKEKKMSENFQVNNYLQRNGFVMVSNLLLDYQTELQINDRELLFIMKALRHASTYKLHDSQLDPTVSERTLQRCRKHLKELGYLNFKVWRASDEDGKLVTAGITYDFTGLEKALQALSDKSSLGNEYQKAHERKYIKEYDEDSPMGKFLEAWRERYSEDYKLTKEEKKWYNSLYEGQQELVSLIFPYCEENNLFGKITPRLSLFMKTPSRWDELKKFAKRDEEENIVQTVKAPAEKEEEPVVDHYEWEDGEDDGLPPGVLDAFFRRAEALDDGGGDLEITEGGEDPGDFSAVHRKKKTPEEIEKEKREIDEFIAREKRREEELELTKKAEEAKMRPARIREKIETLKREIGRDNEEISNLKQREAMGEKLGEFDILVFEVHAEQNEKMIKELEKELQDLEK